MKKQNSKGIIKKQQQKYAVEACEAYYKQFGDIADNTLDALNSALDAMQIDNMEKAFSLIVLSEETNNLVTSKVIS